MVIVRSPGMSKSDCARLGPSLPFPYRDEMDPSHIPATERSITSGVNDDGFCVSSPSRTETLCSHPLGLFPFSFFLFFFGGSLGL